MADTENSGTGVAAGAGAAQGKKLLDRAWDALLAAGFERAAAVRYVDWMRQFILQHGKRHPQDIPDGRRNDGRPQSAGYAGGVGITGSLARMTGRQTRERHGHRAGSASGWLPESISR